MISEFYRTIKAHLYERTTSPLAGALIISWCLWNYSVFIILFSSLPPSEKINLIQASLVDYKISAVGPLVTAAFFIFAYPFPARFVYWFTRKQQKILRDVRQKVEDEELLTKEESHNLRRELDNVQIEYEQEIERKTDEINRLKELLKARDENLKIAKLESDKKSDQIKSREDMLAKKEKELNDLTKSLEKKEALHGEIVYYDDFDNDQGWEQYLDGTVALSDDIQAHSGKYCLKKQDNNDPNGGFKSIGRKINLGFIFSGWIYRPSGRPGGQGDRLAIEDANFNGYGLSVAHGRNIAQIERRDKGSATTISAGVQFNPPQDEWYKFEIHTTRSGRISLYLDDSQGNRLLSAAANDSIHTEFDRVTIHGGHPYYVDDFRIITTQ